MDGTLALKQLIKVNGNQLFAYQTDSLGSHYFGSSLAPSEVISVSQIPISLSTVAIISSVDVSCITYGL